MIISGVQALRFGREDAAKTAPMSRRPKARYSGSDGSTKQQRVDAQRAAEQRFERTGEEPPHSKTLTIRGMTREGSHR